MYPRARRDIARRAADNLAVLAHRRSGCDRMQRKLVAKRDRLGDRNLAHRGRKAQREIRARQQVGERRRDVIARVEQRRIEPSRRIRVNHA